MPSEARFQPLEFESLDTEGANQAIGAILEPEC